MPVVGGAAEVHETLNTAQVIDTAYFMGAIVRNRGIVCKFTSAGQIAIIMGKKPKSTPVSRRNLLGRALALPAIAVIAGAVQAAAATGQGRATKKMWRDVRRVVTTYDSSGRTVVLADGAASNSFEMNGTRVTRLWESSGMPVSLPLGSDLGATAGNAYREGFTGTSFYLAELPGGTRAPTIPLHSSATLDYMAILAGKVAFKMDQDSEIILNTGDTLIQGGNLHTWVNRWRESCLLLFVVVTGQGKRPE